MNDAPTPAFNDLSKDDLSETTSPSTAVPRNSIYLIAAHHNWPLSRVNKRLLAAAAKLPHVTVNDLSASYPDYVIDVEKEQERLANARMVLFVHPIQWYGMPALLKLWFDEVLSYGWAYGPGGAALHGKDFWLTTTTGSKQEDYHPQGQHGHHFEAFLPPYKQTAALCGMRFVPPLVLHGAHSSEAAEVTRFVEQFTHKLDSYPSWTAGLPGGVSSDAGRV